MSHTLIVYEEVPETTKMYLVPNDVITDEQRAKLEKIAGTFMNTDGAVDEGMWLYNVLTAEPEYWILDSESNEAEFGSWARHKATTDLIKDVVITSVVLTGWVL